MAIRLVNNDSKDYSSPTSAGAVGLDERLDFVDGKGNTVASITSDADGTQTMTVGGVKELYLVLTQSGTDAPTASEWLNTTGTTWTPARSNSGQYTLTPADTSCLATPSKVFVIAGGGYGATYSECVYVSTSEIQFNTYNELGNPLDYDGTLWLNLKIKP